LKQGKNLNEIASARKLNLAETGFFLTGAEAPKLGSSRDLSAAIFQLTENKPVPERIFYLNGHYVVLELKERTKPDDRNFAANRENLRNALLQARKTEAVQSWMEGTRTAMIKEGKLKINKDVKDL
jgi:peptidyl-prolyl cis-trans isomerase D